MIVASYIPTSNPHETNSSMVLKLDVNCQTSNNPQLASDFPKAPNDTLSSTPKSGEWIQHAINTNFKLERIYLRMLLVHCSRTDLTLI